VAQTVAYPEITFEYSPFFAALCAAVTKQTVEAEAVKELESRLDLFREHWRKDAPQLLGATVKLTRVKFQFWETKAALHLCKDFGSMSLPLLFDMRYFLKATEGEQARSMTDFTNFVFHETLHRYVTEQIRTLPDKTTPLLVKYRDEPLPIRSHLHLYAIMNEVYRKLDRQKDLESAIAFEQAVKTAPITKRAREIVQKEGGESFIREFRKSR
jgi:hypothetical protein